MTLVFYLWALAWLLISANAIYLTWADERDVRRSVRNRRS